MKSHEVRMVKEKLILDKKLARLSKFIESEHFDGLKKTDAKLLVKQHKYMTKYSDVLAKRINRIKV